MFITLDVLHHITHSGNVQDPNGMNIVQFFWLCICFISHHYQ